MKLSRLVLVTSAFIFLFIPVKSFAVHKGAGGLVCGQCHTMHNSQGRMALNTAGNTDETSMILLRGNINSRGEIHKLCLQCHATNGQWANIKFAPRDVEPPKVYSDAPWDHLTDSFNKIGSGGNFSTELSTTWNAVTPQTLGFGHSVGATDVMPPGGDKTITSFTCTNCHDPHGTDDPNDPNINIFRNLKVKAFESGNDLAGGNGIKFLTTTTSLEHLKMKSYVGGISVTSVNGAYFGGDDKDKGGNTIWPIFTERYGALTGNPINDNGKTNVYATGNDENPGIATMSKWCAQCHDKWHEAVVPENQKHDYTPNGQYGVDLDTRRHAVNSMIPRAAKKGTMENPKGCAGNCHHSLLDRTNYNTELIIQGKGIPVTGSDFYSSGNANVYYLPECGKAGNPGCEGMDHVTTGFNHKVFCFTCHFAHGGPNYDLLRWNYNGNVTTGNQMGNPIESNVGCQLCHNR